jgi:ribonucleoside-triphosphate reductase
MIVIKKRDGSLQQFNQNKIIDAVLAAFKAVDGELDEYAYTKSGNIADFIQEQVENADHILDVEEIQDYVEKGLMATKRKNVARAYITYRNERTATRNRNSQFMKTISEKLTASNVQNQNANVDEYSFGGRMGEANDAVAKQYALDYCVSKMAKENHLNNEIYIHDLGSYAVGSHNCLSIPFDKLLANGFNTRQTDVRPANSINTAFQLVAVIFQLQSLQQFGGVSATHLDWTMVPYVRKSFYKHFKDGFKYCCNYLGGDFDLTEVIEDSDTWNSIIDVPIDASIYTEPEFSDAYNYAMDMTIRETYQAVEGMYHNLNTLQSRSGNQLPFTSINYGTCTLPEGRMITKALLDVSREGIGKLHKTSIFPCGIFQYMKGVNDKPGTPNYDLYRLALQSTSERLYPNYANVDWSGNAGYDRNDPRTYFSTMGKCKLQLI